MYKFSKYILVLFKISLLGWCNQSILFHFYMIKIFFIIKFIFIYHLMVYFYFFLNEFILILMDMDNLQFLLFRSNLVVSLIIIKFKINYLLNLMFIMIIYHFIEFIYLIFYWYLQMGSFKVEKIKKYKILKNNKFDFLSRIWQITTYQFIIFIKINHFYNVFFLILHY